jgi:hypothetical protein
MEQVKEIIGIPGSFIMADIHTTNWSCMDGRQRKLGIFTLGGDLGELLLGLHVYEGIIGHSLEYEKIKEIL